MGCYVIARNDSEFLDSPVFHAGKEGQEEAIAVFTERDSADSYIRAASWDADYSVGELEPVQFLKWLEKARDEGVDMVAINPDRSEQLDGESQSVLMLDMPLDAFAEMLEKELIPQSTGRPEGSSAEASEQSQERSRESGESEQHPVIESIRQWVRSWTAGD